MLFRLIQTERYYFSNKNKSSQILIIENLGSFLWKSEEENHQIEFLPEHICLKRELYPYLCRLYEVKDEGYVEDGMHLELDVGNGQWVGYLVDPKLPIAAGEIATLRPTRSTISRRYHLA